MNILLNLFPYSHAHPFVNGRSKSLISEINYCAQINYPARRHPTVDIKAVPAPYCSCLTKNYVEFAYKSCVSRLAHMCLHKLVRGPNLLDSFPSLQ